MEPHQIVIRPAQLPELLGLSRATIHRLRAAGNFPKPRQLTDGQAIGFFRSDIEAWLASRPVVQQ